MLTQLVLLIKQKERGTTLNFLYRKSETCKVNPPSTKALKTKQNNPPIKKGSVHLHKTIHNDKRTSVPIQEQEIQATKMQRRL